MLNDLSKERGENMIILDQVKKVFQTSSGQVTAVDSVNLEIKKGEIFGIKMCIRDSQSTLYYWESNRYRLSIKRRYS